MKTIIISGKWRAIKNGFVLDFSRKIKSDCIVYVDRSLEFCYRSANCIVENFDNVDSEMIMYYCADKEMLIYTFNLGKSERRRRREEMILELLENLGALLNKELTEKIVNEKRSEVLSRWLKRVANTAFVGQFM